MSSRDPRNDNVWCVVNTQPVPQANGESKIIKNPLIVPTLRWASINRPEDWCSFQKAEEFVRSHPGYILTQRLRDTIYVAVDLDSYKTSDPEILERHRQIYEFLNSYSELSLRGGVHILATTNWVPGGGKAHPTDYVEVIYTSITRTFNALNDKGYESRGEQTREVLAWIRRAHEKNQQKNHPLPTSTEKGEKKSDDGLYRLREIADQPLTDDDQKVLTAAASASNGQLFIDLYFAGDWQKQQREDDPSKPRYPSQSEADLALCNFFSFYSQDQEQIFRLFLHSQLARRLLRYKPKHDAAWLRNTVRKASDRHLPAIQLTSSNGMPVTGGA